MLEFHLNCIRLSGRFILLLPKMTPGQIEIVLDRLTSIGLKIQRGGTLKGKMGRQSFQLNANGWCSSNFDSTDVIAPIIPCLLGTAKEPCTSEEAGKLYFRREKTDRELIMKFVSRIESGTLWTRLREAGECAVTPDEHAVFSGILREMPGRFAMVTDFPSRGAKRMFIGGRMYFAAMLTGTEAASTLRSIDSKHERNSYLPRNGIIRVRYSPRVSIREPDFYDFGEWCSFRPQGTKGLIQEVERLEPAPVV